MQSEMVSARMSAYKKQQGAAVLEELSATPSQAINALYDYLLKHHAFPWDSKKETGKKKYSAREIEDAKSWAKSLKMPAQDIPQSNSPYETMSIKEAKSERLHRKGLI